ncbi:hypothetical protein GN244_ATG17093 [Phytophthora infestans]|uniref:Uncharacterized protein n=1 Tax=Phytophthora infestans TaxID=4787 RepID=A0A833SZC3_PHYIN|nr:hypothetical protein GN244_ATG17093 [Phytophthora infestans]KAF4134830.1 hypothetical protein GN958_ATG16086 [Phytophthora infestans]
MVLGGSVDVAAKVDIFIRQVARSVLRLPFNVNTAVFYDKANGLGLESCEADANTYRLVEALRILNSPSLSVRHVLTKFLEAYQTRAGLTRHPLAYPIAPPRGARSWTAQLIRHAASFDPPLTMAVEWTQPLQTRSSRSNDRPLIDYTPPEQQCSLVAINWKAAFKLRYVGDISNVSGTQIMKLPELMRKGHWSGNERITLESMNDHWVEVLTRPDTNRLRSPVGCTPVELGSTPFQLRIGVGQWIVVVKMNTNGTEPVIDHYEIGYREIGDVGSHPLGRTIPIDGGMNAPAEVVCSTSADIGSWKLNLRQSVYLSHRPTYLRCHRADSGLSSGIQLASTASMVSIMMRYWTKPLLKAACAIYLLSTTATRWKCRQPARYAAVTEMLS